MTRSALHRIIGGKRSDSAFFFIGMQSALLVVCAFLYVLLHIWIPAESTNLDPSRLVHLDAYGRATTVSAEDMDWYVGQAKSVPLLTQLNERNRNIDVLAGSLRQQLPDLATQFTENAAGPVRRSINQGYFLIAADRLATFRAGLAPGTLAGGGDRLFNQLDETLRELSELKLAQTETISLLSPPEKYRLFWANPAGILFEVIAWSLFGLFASLIYHSARFASTGRFKQGETFVGWSKLFYTPIVAVVLVLAVTQGILHVAAVESRGWMIPLFGFLAGFNSRKAAAVVDSLSDSILGRMARSLQGDGADTVEPGVAKIISALPPTRNFTDLAANAKTMLDNTLTATFSQLTNT